MKAPLTINKAATRIQKAIRKARPVNAVTHNAIKDPWHVMWFRDPEHKYYDTYTVNTFKRLKTHPQTRSPKRKRNVMLRRTHRIAKTARPNIGSPKNDNIAKNILKQFNYIQRRIHIGNENLLNYISIRVNGSQERYNKIIAILQRNAPLNL